VEAALGRFRAAGTQVLGVSVDSLHSHANWASSLGGVSFPLLADFHPKGDLAQKLGLFLDGAGISDRATVIIDRDGIVQYAESVGPGGRRNVDELVAACEAVNGGKGAVQSAGAAVEPGTTLFVKSACGPSLRARNALANLKVGGTVAVRNVSEDSAAHADLKKAGKDQAPCLVMGSEVIFDADAICRTLADRVAPL